MASKDVAAAAARSAAAVAAARHVASGIRPLAARFPRRGLAADTIPTAGSTRPVLYRPAAGPSRPSRLLLRGLATASGGGRPQHGHEDMPRHWYDPDAPDVLTPPKDAHGVLEERDPSYDDMLKRMVGRITTKPGGKPEMGEASIVQRYDRPLPKVRTTKSEPGQGGNRQLPQGALDVQHIQEIIQLYQGKSGNHHGPMSVDNIASKFRVEASIVQNIVRFVSLPQDEAVEKKE